MEGDDVLEIDDSSSDEFEVGAPRLGLEQNAQVEHDEDVLLIAVVSDESCKDSKIDKAFAWLLDWACLG
jgi:hypothetical protein